MINELNREGLTFTNKDGQTVFTFTGMIDTGVGKVETADDLKEGDIVTLRNGDRMLFDGENFIDLFDEPHNSLSDIYDLNDDMTVEGLKNSDIMQVERPTKYTTVFERTNEPVEMTLSEICKKLGYEVKIVKEEE